MCKVLFISKPSAVKVDLRLCSVEVVFGFCQLYFTISFPKAKRKRLKCMINAVFNYILLSE